MIKLIVEILSSPPGIAAVAISGLLLYMDPNTWPAIAFGWLVLLPLGFWLES
jgi:hypothetical protein